MKVIRLTIGCSYTDYEQVYVPLKANIEKEFDETEDAVRDFWKLKKHWESLSWGYDGKVTCELVDVYPDRAAADMGNLINAITGARTFTPVIPVVIEEYGRRFDNESDLVKCAEFDIYCFESEAYASDMYDSPYQSKPNQDEWFCSGFAYDCMKGDIYSKDFRYFHCGDCERTICEQSPSNGWHSQYRTHPEWEDERICLKCFEEYVIENGTDLKRVIKNKQLSGMMFDDVELTDKGFAQVDGWVDVGIASGWSSYYDVDDFFARLKTAHETFLRDKLVVISFESLAIGGMGGYITLWAKDRPFTDRTVQYMFAKRHDKICPKCNTYLFTEVERLFWKSAYAYACLVCDDNFYEEQAIDRPLLTEGGMLDVEQDTKGETHEQA